ncbi:uncharacterized protein LOC111240954 [Vigna radiata var. radiata]|uniref:Uncharacterized protein LOC111240954 n=1 Tax=Vigna radiata var. radiata TaxID=3916 RepID=A0A3Q0ELN9_VIGRR|nr:uncharacterized protein LOC111240954 [Vigna radiata var. radiata]
MTLGSRRPRTAGSKRKEIEQLYSHQFKTPAHARYFSIVEGKKLLMECKVRLITASAPQFGREITNRGWLNLTTYPASANPAIVKEFYTNARALGGEPETYSSYLRGRRIPFDANTINTFLGTDWEGGRCQYEQTIIEGVDYEDVVRTLCLPRERFELSRVGVPTHLKRSFLIPMARYWMTFTQANILPCLHVSDITSLGATFLFCVMSGRGVNIGSVIADEIRSCTRNLHTRTPLGHPS